MTFKIAPSGHDNTLPSGADGGPAAAFFITFENGFTVFFNGHSTLMGDLPLYAALYKPDLAILGLARRSAGNSLRWLASLRAVMRSSS